MSGPEVAEQVESMGAEFVHVDFEAEKSADGYAKEMTAEQEAATASMYDEEACRRHCHHDRPDPRASGAEAAQRGDRRRDERGSVIVDMAAGPTAAMPRAPSPTRRSSPTTVSRSSATPTSPADSPRRRRSLW